MNIGNDMSNMPSINAGTGGPDPDVSGSKTRTWQRPVFRIGALCAGIFVIGVALGAGVTVHLILDRVKGAFRDPEVMADRMVRQMDSTLDLTDEQEPEIKALLIESVTRIRGAVHDEFNNVHVNVSKVLTEEQKKIFDEKLKNRMHSLGMPLHEHGNRP
jgi:hypothetical protein